MRADERKAGGDERGFCIAQLIVSGLACVIIPCPPAFGTGAGWLVLDEGEKDRVDGLVQSGIAMSRLGRAPCGIDSRTLANGYIDISPCNAATDDVPPSWDDLTSDIHI